MSKAYIFFVCPILMAFSPLALSQGEPPRFRPTFPPAVIDAEEFDELEEEADTMEFEEGEDVPPAPPDSRPATSLPGQPGGGMSPSFGGGGGGKADAFGTTKGQVRFKIVEGEFWEEGKKRPRGEKQNR